MRLILTYHAARLESLTRSGCDVLALAADLECLADMAVPVRPLDVLLNSPHLEGVAITLDDGSRLDAESHLHPRLGWVPSMVQVLQQARRRLPEVCASSFVIASAEARAAIAAGLAETYGDDLMHERWWRSASDSGLLSIENHSWDHNHPLVPCTAQRDNQRGGFLSIETDVEAEQEIAAASAYVYQAVGRRPRYFAYPFGDVSPFLRDDWLPRRGSALGLEAALTTEPRPLTEGDDRWALPRFVCGRDWQDDVGLERVIYSR